jgi:hypothetical protein
MSTHRSVSARLARACALALLASGLGASACDKKSDASTESATSAMLGAVSGDLRVEAGEHGFAPAQLALPRGGPGSRATVTFVRTTDKTCATEVVFPELGVTKPLPLNETVPVDVPTDSARTLSFQCGMAMYKGALVVR